MIEMGPYEEARPFSRGIGKYTKSEEETRAKSGRQDTGRQYVPRKPVTIAWEPILPAIRRGSCAVDEFLQFFEFKLLTVCGLDFLLRPVRLVQDRFALKNRFYVFGHVFLLWSLPNPLGCVPPQTGAHWLAFLVCSLGSGWSWARFCVRCPSPPRPSTLAISKRQAFPRSGCSSSAGATGGIGQPAG